MGQFKFFKKIEISDSLKETSRQYLVGNLMKPQILDFLFSENLEIGITAYSSYQSEPAHRHSIAIEYQYVLSGRTQYMDIDTKEVHEFTKGDFYAIYPNTSYAQRSKPGTEILFIKIPSINDKETVSIDNEVNLWLNKKLKTVRTDHFFDLEAPQPNSIKPAAAVAIVQANKILLLKRSDNGKWTMPGGTLEYGETLHNCAIREVKEESGLDIIIQDIIGTYTNPNILIEYSDGEVRQEFTIVYSGIITGGTIQIDEESTAYKWISLDEVDEIDMVQSQRIRINDVKHYIQTGKKGIR